MQQRILIIEDEERIRHVMKDYLKQEGFKIYEADNGEEGLAIFEREKIDLIVPDLKEQIMEKIDVGIKSNLENSNSVIPF